jgi:hypothetical protein
VLIIDNKVNPSAFCRYTGALCSTSKCKSIQADEDTEVPYQMYVNLNDGPVQVQFETIPDTNFKSFHKLRD